METKTELETVSEAEDLLEKHSQEEEQAFLNTLSDDVDFDPSQTETTAEKESENFAVEAAAGMVCMGLMTAESTLKMMVHKDFKFDPDQAENVAYKVAPLIVKYGANPPPWLEKYMDEIMAVFAIGVLAFSSFMQVRQLKAADKIETAANDDETPEKEAA